MKTCQAVLYDFWFCMHVILSLRAKTSALGILRRKEKAEGLAEARSSSRAKEEGRVAPPLTWHHCGCREGGSQGHQGFQAWGSSAQSGHSRRRAAAGELSCEELLQEYMGFIIP